MVTHFLFALVRTSSQNLKMVKIQTGSKTV